MRKLVVSTRASRKAAVLTGRSSAAAVLASLSLGAAAAEPGAATNNSLAQVIVTATKVPTSIDSVAGAVSVITDTDAERRVVQDIKDLVRYEPGVSVRDQGSRFGPAGFTVRGVDGDRVAIEVDGVPLADAFSIGSFSNASRDFVDLDLMKRTEIIRGPASSLYGSDALGGVVTFVSKDPRDYYDGRRSGNGQGGDEVVGFYRSFKTQYAGADDSFAGTAVLAGVGDTFGGSLAYVRREGHEIERTGDKDVTGAQRTSADPADFQSDSAIAKLGIYQGALRGFEITVDGARARNRSDALSQLTATTTRLEGDDETERLRTSLEWVPDGGLGPFEYFSARTYWQDSITTQLTSEDRIAVVMGAGTPLRRDRRFEFDQEILGGELVTQQSLHWGGVEHALTAGAEIEQTGTTQLRDGLQTNLATGATTPVVGPDTFPVRDFPRTSTLEAGLFLQDEIRFGAVTLIPGVRVDHFDLDPKPDSIFLADNPGVPVVSIDETSVSPKLGIVWKISEELSAFAQYAHGFRGPPYDDVNIGFTNLAFGYTSIPNPDLEPETSDGFELGLRRSGGRLHFALSGFYSRYQDFIESFVNLGVNPDTGLLTFQSRNVAEVTIYGAEASAFVDLEEWARGFGLRSAFGWAHGTDDTENVPLDSIDPLRLVMGFGYHAPAGRWSLEVVGTATEKKTRSNDAPLTSGAFVPQFEPPASYVFDLLAHWRLNDSADLRLALYNLADRKYWDWQDVRGSASTSSALDRFSRPGRVLNASFRIQW